MVRKAPLTVPPEYNLRPPTPGSSRPQELSTESQARVAVFGLDVGQGVVAPSQCGAGGVQGQQGGKEDAFHGSCASQCELNRGKGSR